MLTVAVHEMGHVMGCICFGYHAEEFCIDPIRGGKTSMRRDPLALDVEIYLPLPALPMGYLFNIVVGGVLTFCGFDTLASKIASCVSSSSPPPRVRC